MRTQLRPAMIGHKPKPPMESPEASTQRLMQVLGVIRFSQATTIANQLAMPWSYQVAAGPPILYRVQDGKCWWSAGDDLQPRELSTGDVLLMPQGASHTLQDQPRAATVPLADWASASAHGDGSRNGKVADPLGSSTSLQVATLTIEDPQAATLFRALPAAIAIPAAGRSLQRLFDVLDAHPHTDSVFVTRLLELIAIEIVQRGLAETNTATGWIGALTDTALGPVVAAMQGRPEEPWTLASLSRKAGLSRSLFAARFANVVGVPPARFLFERRMEAACKLLASGRCRLKEVATRVGYESDTAFSSAFKRWAGVSPGAYRKQRRES